MATSRTGTAIWKRNRERVLKQAQKAGLVRCPGFLAHDNVFVECGNNLDYKVSLQPNSAEVDHIKEVKFGGTDEIENLRVLCRSCNGKRNTMTPTAKVAPPSAFRTLRIW